MTNREIEVEKKLLKNEQHTFNKLKQAYAKALADIKKQVKELQKHSEMPSKIYQIKYQQALEQQTNDILDILNNSNISTVDAFLMLMYEDGYAGIMYSLQGQNIPLAIPIDQNLMIKSISRETDSVKLSSRLYNNVEELKKTVIAEISRGIASNQDYRDIAVVLSDKGNTSFKRAYTIARTEGHRVSIEAKSDAINKSIENGADLVKMWDATLDGKTRQSHASLDHKWVENDESFTTVDDITGQEVNAPFPGAFGIANMDINCRCVLLARPRWAVENEQSYEKWDNENHRYITLSRKTGFEKWYEKYVANNSNNGIMKPTDDKEVKDVHYIGKIDKEIYKCVTDDIVTDEVIITEKQIEHIKLRHPNDYERFSKYFNEIISQPDYLIEANKPNSALVLKEIRNEDEQFKMVVRIATSEDNPDIKNSVITFMKIDDKEWNRILRNKKILYKSE